MPDQTPYLGTYLTAYVPNPDGLIDLGYDTVRFYTATSEGGSYSLVGTAALAAGTYDYNYNDTSGTATDWFYWVPYSVANGEGTGSEPQPVGPPRITRLNLRQDVGRFLRMVDVYAAATVDSATQANFSEFIDADLDVDTIGGRFARCVAGTAIGQTRRVRTGSNGVTSLVNGTIVVGRAFSPAWVANDTIEFWEPEGDRDPSVLIDNIMQVARFTVWWEDVFYFTGESNVTEFTMPRMMRENYVKRVEYAAGTYPSRPDWQPVAAWELTGEIMGVYSSPTARTAYGAGTVFRVTWNRYGDRMDSDTDYWEVDREYAMLVVASAYLTSRAAPRGNEEDVRDALRALEAVNVLLAPMRRALTPSGVASINGPR